MTDSVDTTAALRVLADNINVAPAIWGHDAVRPLRAAADEIDALRARAERAEAVIARASQPASDPRETEHIECDCVPHLGPTHCHLCSTRTGREMPWSEAHPQPASEVEQ